MTLRTLNYGSYGIFLIMGHAGFCPSTVVLVIVIVIATVLVKVKGIGTGIGIGIGIVMVIMTIES